MRASAVYLKPGDLCHAESPTVVSTILGSCVAVIMFNPGRKVGSICHAMLPRNPSSHRGEAFRYVDSSILYMVERFRALGVRTNEMEVKLFGGADVLEHRGENGASVGRQNIEIALETIGEVGLRLIVSDVGGKVGRKLCFYTHTGEVLLKRMAGSAVQTTWVPGDTGMTFTYATGRRGYGE
jgi:chemotaxis protein CheD